MSSASRVAARLWPPLAELHASHVPQGTSREMARRIQMLEANICFRHLTAAFKRCSQVPINQPSSIQA